MKTEQLTKPKKLFTITITIYVLLLCCILAACYFVEYPTIYAAKPLKIEKIKNKASLKVALPIGSQLNVGDRVSIGDKGNKQQKVLITAINQEGSQMTVVLLVDSSSLKALAIKSEPLKLTKYQKLFTILIKRSIR